MSLENILQESRKRDQQGLDNAAIVFGPGYDKQVLTEERMDAQIDNYRKMIAFFRAYPDLFIDFIKGPDCKFNFLHYQRSFLRATLRYRYVYATYPRGFSKSFLSMLSLMIKCILYPGVHLAVTTAGKQQAAQITIQKIQEICKLIPALSNQLDWSRGVSKRTKDDVHYIFKNDSSIDILAAKDSSRGQRRHGILIEECALIDGEILNTVIIPTTVVDRRLPDGTKDPGQVVNQSQVYITTAGWKSSYAYERLIELLVQSIIEPEQVYIMGGTYKTPILEGLQKESFLEDLRMQGSFNEESFDREYRSIWSGDSLNAFYSSDKFDKSRVLNQPEYQYSKRSTKDAFYILGVDVGRSQCTTEISVCKFTPQPNGAAIKSFVNFFSIAAEDFEEQAIKLKKLFYKYLARVAVIDANGVGFGFVDFLTKAQVDPETGDTLPPFGVLGGTFEEADKQYKKIKGVGVQENALFLMKANAPINTQAYAYAQTQMSSNKIKFLVDEAQAKSKLMTTKMGRAMTAAQRNQYLRPFILTSVLKAQLLNLVEENQGVNIILKQANRGIPKDRFSSFIYALYFAKQEEERLRKRKKHSLEDFLFFS